MLQPNPSFPLDLHPYLYDTIDIMKKVWVYKRTSINGWWVGWYESGKRKAKALPSKELAEHYKHIKYTHLNSDVFTGQVLADWSQMIAEYREAKKVQGVTEGTLYEIALSLRNFERLVGKCSSKQITQNALDQFILQRGIEVSRPTLNKDIRNLKTFINWCRKKRYINNEIELRELKEEEKPVRSLNDAEIKKLLKATEVTIKHLLFRTLLVRVPSGNLHHAIPLWSSVKLRALSNHCYDFAFTTHYNVSEITN